VPIVFDDGDVAAAVALVGAGDALTAVGEPRLRQWLDEARHAIQARLPGVAH
jgi:DNA-binding IclR family transcriptional regulator